MKYYELIYSDVEEDVIVLTDYLLQGFKYTNILLGKPVKDWRKDIQLYYEEGKVLEDYLSNPLSWPVVSPRMADALIRLNLQFLPINISHKTSKKEISGYQVVNILELTPALNLQQSIYDSYDNHTGRVRGLVKLVIDKNKIKPGVHIFRLIEYPFIFLISEDLKNLLQKENITGIDFVSVKEG